MLKKHHYGSGIAARFLDQQHRKKEKKNECVLFIFIFMRTVIRLYKTTSGEPTAAQTTKNRPLDKILSTLHFNRILALFFFIFSRAFLVVQGSV